MINYTDRGGAVKHMRQRMFEAKEGVRISPQIDQILKNSRDYNRASQSQSKEVPYVHLRKECPHLHPDTDHG
jgi:hypothetical protein